MNEFITGIVVSAVIRYLFVKFKNNLSYLLQIILQIKRKSTLTQIIIRCLKDEFYGN